MPSLPSTPTPSEPTSYHPERTDPPPERRTNVVVLTEDDLKDGAPLPPALLAEPAEPSAERGAADALSRAFGNWFLKYLEAQIVYLRSGELLQMHVVTAVLHGGRTVTCGFDGTVDTDRILDTYMPRLSATSKFLGIARDSYYVDDDDLMRAYEEAGRPPLADFPGANEMLLVEGEYLNGGMRATIRYDRNADGSIVVPEHPAITFTTYYEQDGMMWFRPPIDLTGPEAVAHR